MGAGGSGGGGGGGGDGDEEEEVGSDEKGKRTGRMEMGRGYLPPGRVWRDLGRLISEPTGGDDSGWFQDSCALGLGIVSKPKSGKEKSRGVRSRFS
jgi:hypothetical protein